MDYTGIGAGIGSFFGPGGTAVGAAGGSIANALFNKKKKATMQDPNYPDYNSFQNPNDQPADSQLYNFYSNRAAGKNVGYSPDDLSTMNAAAIDQSTHEGNELTRRATAGRQARLAGSAGDTSTGAQDYIQQQSIGQTLASRSKAMRDLNISNAALKQQQIEDAAKGLQTNLSADREQQLFQYEAALNKAQGINSAAQSVAKLNSAGGAADDTLNTGAANSIGALLAKYGPNALKMLQSGSNTPMPDYGAGGSAY